MEHGAKRFTPPIWFALPITITDKEHDVHTTDEEAEAAEGIFAWPLMPGCQIPKVALLTPVPDELPGAVASGTAFCCVPR